jgi:glycine/D-amino acid oxidase-like deaminating enzyme
MQGAESGRNVLSANLRTTPYWWDAAPRPALPPAPLPKEIDVAIVGSGCTGLSAALSLARAGRSVAVLEAGDPGQGATSRATGALGRTLKHGFSELFETLGQERAVRIYGDMRAAFDFVIALIEREAIDCDLAVRGRFMGANTPRHYEAMARDLELKQRHLGDDFAMVPRAEQHREIASDLFHGGAVIPDHRMLHPGKFHLGLLARAQDAGAAIFAHTRVEGISRDGQGFVFATSRGWLRSREAIVATNGYTGSATPYLRRRVVSLNAYMVASELLPAQQLVALLPNLRCFHDYSINADYGCPAPDAPRLLFGGLTGSLPHDLPSLAARLHARLLRVFPQLADVRLSHVWTGACAATFDLFPHIGRHDGVYYAMGYCFGSGLPLGCWFGDRLARRILGQEDSATAFDALPFETRFFHWGPPWFVPLVIRYYAWSERRGF